MIRTSGTLGRKEFPGYNWGWKWIARAVRWDLAHVAKPLPLMPQPIYRDGNVAETRPIYYPDPRSRSDQDEPEIMTAKTAPAEFRRRYDAAWFWLNMDQDLRVPEAARTTRKY